MNDRKRWELRGPVRTCDVERTWFVPRCGSETCEVEESGDSTRLEFRSDGGLAETRHRNPDGSEWTTVYHYRDDGRLGRVECSNLWRRVSEYDSSGRLARVIAWTAEGSEHTAETYEYEERCKKKTVLVDTGGQTPNAWGVEGTDSFYPGHGAKCVTTVYDERDRPVEMQFRLGDGQLISRVTLRYDESGNLVEEAQSNADEAVPTALRDSLNAEQLETIRVFFGVSEPNRRLHRYDERGRRIESYSRMGPLSETRTTTEYNEFGDPVCQSTEEASLGEVALTELGQIQSSGANPTQERSEARFTYDYDVHGNWLTKTVEVRWSTEAQYRLSARERRKIEYFN